MEDSTSVFVEYMRKKGEELVDEAKKYASKIKSDAKKSIEFNLIKIGG
jgi:F0F1-type ATP synthase membrane subunit b/b'